MRSRRNHGVSLEWLVSCGLCVLWMGAAGSAAELDNVTVLVESGERAPDDAGVFDNLTVPVHSGDGQVAFATHIKEGSSIVASRIYRVNDKTLTQIVAEGDPAPDGNGNIGDISPFLFAPQVLLVNEAGQVAFPNTFVNTFGEFSDDRAILIGDGESLSIVAREGQVANGVASALRTIGQLADMNEQGQLVFRATLNSLEAGIFRGGGSPSELSVIALTDHSLPGGGAIGSFPDVGPSMNHAGEVAFVAQIAGSAVQGIYVGNGNDPLVEIVREGDSIPSGAGTFADIPTGSLLSGFDYPTYPLNDRREVAFFAELEATPGGAMDNAGLFLGDGSQLIELVRRGNSTPDGNGSFLDIGPGIALDNAGRVAFFSTITGSSGGAGTGLFLADRQGVRQVVRQNDPAPGGGVFSSFEYFSGISASVGLLFGAYVDLQDGGFNLDRIGVYLYDGSAIRSVVQSGDTNQGAEVLQVDSIEDRGSGLEGNALGQSGSVAVWFQVNSGQQKIALWSEISIFDDGFESGDLLGWSASVP